MSHSHVLLFTAIKNIPAILSSTFLVSHPVNSLLREILQQVSHLSYFLFISPLPLSSLLSSLTFFLSLFLTLQEDNHRFGCDMNDFNRLQFHPFYRGLKWKELMKQR